MKVEGNTLLGQLTVKQLLGVASIFFNKWKEKKANLMVISADRVEDIPVGKSVRLEMNGFTGKVVINRISGDITVVNNGDDTADVLNVYEV